MRRRLHLTFSCEGSTLAATLDTAPLTTGLLLVSGGNEIRSGAFRGQARLAQTIAKRGFPVFRYDRRGIGDSEGENLGFTQSEPDIRAAIEAFRAIAPQVNRVFALGNCDAASALMLASGAGCDGLVLSNPWTIEDDADDSPPPQAIRARYAEKLRNPREVARLLRGAPRVFAGQSRDPNARRARTFRWARDDPARQRGSHRAGIPGRMASGRRAGRVLRGCEPCFRGAARKGMAGRTTGRSPAQLRPRA